MTNTVHFDVHEYIKNARKYGVKEDLAEFQAREIEKAITEAISALEDKEFAKKSDLFAHWRIGITGVFI